MQKKVMVSLYYYNKADNSKSTMWKYKWLTNHAKVIIVKLPY